MTAKIELCRRFFHKVWAEGDTRVIEEMMAKSAEIKTLGDRPRIGPEGFKAFHREFCGLVSDIEITIDQAVEQGDWLAVLCTMRARCRRSGKPVTFRGQSMIRFEGDQGVEAYDHWDFLGLFSQLGMAPQDAFARGMRGEALA